MSKQASTTLIGAFVIGGLALAVALLLIFGSGKIFRKTHPFILYFAGNVNGLNIGAPVKFKGVNIGEVTKVLIRFDQPSSDIHVPVIIEMDEKKMRDSGIQETHLRDPNFMKNTIEEGLRAQLATQSMVTGLLYISLDFKPDKPAHFVGESTQKYQEIPTIPTSMEEAQTIIKRSLNVLDPESPLMVQMQKTLEEIGDTARSVRILTDYLDRNPSAVLTGRSPERRH